jgi:hypothetical protein
MKPKNVDFTEQEMDLLSKMYGKIKAKTRGDVEKTHEALVSGFKLLGPAGTLNVVLNLLGSLDDEFNESDELRMRYMNRLLYIITVQMYLDDSRKEETLDLDDIMQDLRARANGSTH